MKAYGLIDVQYLFSTYNEYKKKKSLIEERYLKAWIDKKIMYKFYIYSRPILTKEEKDKIWQEINKKSELFETKEEYYKKRGIIAKAYATWSKQRIVMYRTWFFAKDIPEKRLLDMWEEINKYSSLVNGSKYESSS